MGKEEIVYVDFREVSGFRPFPSMTVVWASPKLVAFFYATLMVGAKIFLLLFNLAKVHFLHPFGSIDFSFFSFVN